MSTFQYLLRRGGLNSLANFARSNRRAASFKKVQPILKTVSPQGDNAQERLEEDEEAGVGPEGEGPEEERDDG